MYEEPNTHKPMAKAIGYIGIVVLFMTLGILFFDNEIEHRVNPNQSPESRTSGGRAEVILEGNRAGHYVASGYINRQEVVFLLDTGASNVSIPEPLADKLGLKRGAPHQASTANGTITVYSTRLQHIQLGTIELKNIEASINPHMLGDEILLGMSFLRHLEFTQRGDTLTLRSY